MDREMIADLRLANEACMTLLTLMAIDDSAVSAAELVAEDDAYAQRTTCMALASFANAAVSALAEAMNISVEEIIQTAAMNAALHGVELEQMLEESDDDEGPR